MPQMPPLHEVDFLRKAPNHKELEGKLSALGINAPELTEYGKHICACWFKLAEDHLVEARGALSVQLSRSVYSRSYYAAYNASKAARYIVKGTVSLKGDDHPQASVGLPDDFPDVANWSDRINNLYQHRLRADYDNWSDTVRNQTLVPADTIALASAFIDEVRKYVNSKFGAFL